MPSLASLALALTAQPALDVAGTVASTDGRAIAGAVVVVAGAAGPGADDATRTNGAGIFRLRGVAPGTRLVVARVGYAPDTVEAAPRVAVVLARAALALDPTLVRADRALSAASSSAARAVDVALRPRASSQELLRLAPGLVIAQHAGGGKAEQIFLRGVDADHGTDVAVSVDDVPVNVVSHAHGQGYADLHFLMPEVVERVDVRKGPYDPRDGDLATAGAVRFVTRDRVDAARVEARGGSFRSAHASGVAPLGAGYVAGSASHADGPFDVPQGYRRGNGFAKWTRPVEAFGGRVVTATASASAGRWDASGQIPGRVVPTIGRFGAIDATEGGSTSRVDAAVGVRAADERWDAKVWATRYRFRLFSNFTFYRDDAERGDGIEQRDARTIAGAHARGERRVRVFGRDVQLAGGAETRFDAATVELHHQAARVRLEPRAVDALRQLQLGTWSEARVALGRARLAVGARHDAFRFGVRSALGGANAAGGAEWARVVSPKASVAFDAGGATTLYANAGAGFHSNDARGVARAAPGDRVLPRALGAELGARRAWSGGTLAAAAWRLDLADELVWVGDEGTTASGGRTRRVGVDVEARQRLARWLWADADVTAARGRALDGAPDAAGRFIPLAPPRTATAGLTMRDAGPATLAARVRHIAARPANEDNSVRARATTVAELVAGWEHGRTRVVVAVDNLLDAAWNEAQFATTSRLRGERADVTELHFTPGAPRTLHVGVQRRF